MLKNQLCLLYLLKIILTLTVTLILDLTFTISLRNASVRNLTAAFVVEQTHASGVVLSLCAEMLETKTIIIKTLHSGGRKHLSTHLQRTIEYKAEFQIRKKRERDLETVQGGLEKTYYSVIQRERERAVSYTHLDVYKRQVLYCTF